MKARELDRSGLSTFIYTGVVPDPLALSHAERARGHRADRQGPRREGRDLRGHVPESLPAGARAAGRRAQAGGRHERQGRRHALPHGQESHPPSADLRAARPRRPAHPPDRAHARQSARAGDDRRRSEVRPDGRHAGFQRQPEPALGQRHRAESRRGRAHRARRRRAPRPDHALLRRQRVDAGARRPEPGRRPAQRLAAHPAPGVAPHHPDQPAVAASGAAARDVERGARARHRRSQGLARRRARTRTSCSSPRI